MLHCVFVLGLDVFYSVWWTICIILWEPFLYWKTCFYSFLLKSKWNQIFLKNSVEYVICCVILLIIVFVNTIFIIQTTCLCWFCESSTRGWKVYLLFLLIFVFISLKSISILKIWFLFYFLFFRSVRFSFLKSIYKNELSVEYNQFNERSERSIHCVFCVVCSLSKFVQVST